MAKIKQAPARWYERLGIWSSAIQTLFGYDFFISYAWSDGRPYAQQLARQLAEGQPRFRCFLDEKDMGGGEAWRQAVFKALRHSSILVVVGSNKALQRDAVYEEILAFGHTGRPIVPIDFDAGVAGLGRDHRLHHLIEERLRTEEPSGSHALAAGTVHGSVLAFLRTSFRFVRVHRIRVLVLAAAVLVLGSLLLLSVVGFIAARQGRLLAESRERDATIALVRFASSRGDYDDAARLLDGSHTSDRRLEWAAWALRHHRRPDSRTVQSIAGGGPNASVLALSFNQTSDRLAGLVQRINEVGASACAASMVLSKTDMRNCLGGVHLMAFDAQTGAAGPSIRVGNAASHLAAHRDGDEFLVATDETVERYALRDGQWVRLAFADPQPPGEVVLLENAGLGVLAAQGRAWQLRFDGTTWIRSLLPVQGSVRAVVRGPDGSSVALLPPRAAAPPHEQAPMLAMVSPDGNSLAVWTTTALPPDARLLGGGRLGWLDQDDRLHVRPVRGGDEVLTRRLKFKPRLGAALAMEGWLLVQEVADEDREPRTRIAVLDAATGEDLGAGFLAREPIRAMAQDRLRSRVFLAGQGSWLTMATLPSERVLSIPAPSRLEGPLSVTGPSKLELRYADDANERRRAAVDLSARTMVAAEPAYPSVPHQRGDIGWLRDHACPQLADVSPDGERIAFAGDALVIARLTASERQAHVAGRLDLGATCQRILEDERRVEWRPQGHAPPQNLRWLSGSRLVEHGFHGSALLIDVSARSITSVGAKEAVTALSRSGPVLVSTLAGRVYRVDSQGAFESFGQLSNLRALYPIDARGEAFVAWMENPRRTAFVVQFEGHLQEVMSVADSGIPLDARRLAEGLVVLYRQSVRVYANPMPAGPP